jgi:glutamyl-tRNA synthetase
LFSLEKCSKNGAKFDYKKAEWFNRHYIQSQSDTAIAILLESVLNKKGIEAPQDQIIKIAGLIKDRIHFITESEIWNQSAFFFTAPDCYDEKTVNKRWKEDSPDKMQALISVLQTTDDFSASTTEASVMSWIESNNYSTGEIMNAFRLALVGESKGPHIFHITEIIGKGEVIKRLEKAIKVLNSS